MGCIYIASPFPRPTASCTLRCRPCASVVSQPYGCIGTMHAGPFSRDPLGAPPSARGLPPLRGGLLRRPPRRWGGRARRAPRRPPAARQAAGPRSMMPFGQGNRGLARPPRRFLVLSPFGRYVNPRTDRRLRFSTARLPGTCCLLHRHCPGDSRHFQHCWLLWSGPGGMPADPLAADACNIPQAPAYWP